MLARAYLIFRMPGGRLPSPQTRMADVHGFGRPNLLSRLYLRLGGIGVASRIYYVLDLADRIDPSALRRALAGLLEDWPQLRSRAVRHWHG